MKFRPTRRDLFLFLHTRRDNATLFDYLKNGLQNYIIEQLQIQYHCKEVKNKVLQVVKNFCRDIYKKLQHARRHWDLLQQQNESWLNEELKFSLFENDFVIEASTSVNTATKGG